MATMVANDNGVTVSVPASRRVVDVAELLDCILNYLPRQNLLRTALVCRFWASIALDHLWKVIPNFEVLLGAGFSVNPLKFSGLVELETPTRDEGWKIIANYARRVQRIDYSEGNFEPLTLACLTTRLRPTGDDKFVFPNIRALRCSTSSGGASLPIILRMMSSDLQEFSLHAVRGPRETVNVSSALVARILQVLSSGPFLSLIKLIAVGNVFEVREAFEALLAVVKLQQNLRTLALHPSGFADKFLEAFGYHYRLTSLTIEQRTTSLESVAQLFDCIGRSYPNLEDFSIKLHENLEGELPLSKLQNLKLRALKIQGVGSKHLTVEMVSAMGQWWPCMQDFEFGRQSMIPRGECAPLCRLNDIARVWPELRSVEVVFEFEGEVLPRPEHKFHVK